MANLLARLAALLRPRPTPPRPPAVVPPSPHDNNAIAMIAEINGRRAGFINKSYPPLAVSTALMRAAGEWAVAMAHSGRMSHDNFAVRSHAAVGFVPSAENVAAGQPDAAVVAAWMGSPGHRANVLGPYDAVGWAVASGSGGPYWCAIFADLGGP